MLSRKCQCHRSQPVHEDKRTRSISNTALAIWAATWQNQQNECTPSEDSDQPGHPPSPNRVFAVRMKKAWVLNYPLSAQRRLWSDWADLSLHCAHSHFVGFVMSRLIWSYNHLQSLMGLALCLYCHEAGQLLLMYRLIKTEYDIFISYVLLFRVYQ